MNIEKFITGLHEYLKDNFAPLIERITNIEKKYKPLEERIKTLEARKPDKGERGEKGAAGEKGERGEQGEQGIAGRDGRDGKDGKDGENGKDGKNGKDGERGTDGLGFEDLSVEQVDERTVAIKFMRGEEVKSFDIHLPALIYRDIYKHDVQYEVGDAVTYGGSLWIAKESVKGEKPDITKKWKLAVKKGRDGKQGERGEKGERGKDGKDGRDLTQKGFNGEKW